MYTMVNNSSNRVTKCYMAEQLYSTAGCPQETYIGFPATHLHNRKNPPFATTGTASD
jgi:hypothetical protein